LTKNLKMTKVRFIYQSDDYNEQREIIATKVCEYMATRLDLPEEIQVEFAVMHESQYGATLVNPRFKNRIQVNNVLTAQEIPQVLVHELIHLNQIKTGRLSNTSNGKPVWDGRTYQITEDTDPNQLPWEQDVANKQRLLLAKTVSYLRQNS